MASQVNSPVAILGMHRSGTSCLAGSLQEAGLYLGEVNEAAPHNARGNRENRIIMDIHDELLAANNGSWDVPPADFHWNVQDRARVADIIASYPDDVVWGFKDPRTLVTLPLWLSLLPELRFVGTIRHPVAVARSLQARNNFSFEFSFNLWVAYNKLLLSYHEHFGFGLINFDVSEQDYQFRVASIACNLNLKKGGSDNTFFENSLRHEFTDSTFRLPEEVTSVYSALLERVG